MKLRARIRRWWIGPSLYDYAVLSCRLADNSEHEGRDNAYAFLRKSGLEHLIPEELLS